MPIISPTLQLFVYIGISIHGIKKLQCKLLGFFVKTVIIAPKTAAAPDV